MTEPVRLALITPRVAEPDAFAPALEAACAAAPVAAVLLRLEAADERTLVNRVKALAPRAQGHGAAVLVWVVGEARPGLDVVTLAVRGGADGVHATGPEGLSSLRERLGGERTLGVGGLRSRHDAMLAGEAGVDYLLFGEPRPDGTLPPLDQVAERAGWWAEIFETPCIAVAPTLEAVGPLAGTGAEFVALAEAAWSHPGGPAAALKAAQAALDQAAPDKGSRA